MSDEKRCLSENRKREICERKMEICKEIASIAANYSERPNDYVSLQKKWIDRIDALNTELRELLMEPMLARHFGFPCD